MRWRSNLAMMLANPTAGDTEVIARLGDQLKASHEPRPNSNPWDNPQPYPCPYPYPYPYP